MNVRFLQSAQYELDDAVDYYNAQVPDLGQAFLLEVLAGLKRVCNFPDAWHAFSSETRRCQLRRFPYGIIYAVENVSILLLAVGHLHRSPDFWRSISLRVKN